MEKKINKWELTVKMNVRLLAYWTLGWVLTLAIATFGPKFLWNFNSVISIVFIAVNVIVGIGMILVNKKYIAGLDEMQRKVNMDAMAVALGVGLVGGLCFSALEIAKIVFFDAEIAYLIMLMSVTYMIAFIIGNVRFK